MAACLDVKNEDRGKRRGEEKKRNLDALTGEGLLIVLPHGNEVSQAGVELLHDGLKKKQRGRGSAVNQEGGGNISIATHTHTHTQTHKQTNRAACHGRIRPVL